MTTIYDILSESFNRRKREQEQYIKDRIYGTYNPSKVRMLRKKLKNAKGKERDKISIELAREAAKRRH